MSTDLSNAITPTTTVTVFRKTQPVSPEAVAFLGFVAACLVILIVFFMYLNKMFCFSKIGGFPCIEKPPKKHFDATTGREYGLAEDDEDEDPDSEDDAVNQFQRHKSVRLSTVHRSPPSAPIDIATDDRAASPDVAASAVATAIDSLALTSPESNVAPGGADTENQRPIDTEMQPILDGAQSGSDSKEPSIEIGLCYFSSRGELTINVKQIKNAPSPDHHYQVHVTILPSKKYTFRTNNEKGDNPLFLSLFSCRIPADTLPDSYVRLRLYSRNMVFAPTKLAGAAIISLATLPKDVDISRWAPLQPSEEGLWAIDAVEAPVDQQTQRLNSNADPTLTIGLAYSALTGRLAVEIGQAQGINKLVRQAPQKLETYVKVLVMLGPTADRLLAQTKTRLNKGYSPAYKEKFVFQVAQFQLNDVSIGVMVYTRRRENIGWIAIGSVAEPGSQESTHWSDLRSAAATHSSDLLSRTYVIRPPEQASGASSAFNRDQH